MRGLILGLLLLVGNTATAIAADVRPTDRVQHNVVVRADATTTSAPLAVLNPGDTLPLETDLARWYKVRLPDGRVGFVSKAWTEILAAIARGGFTLHVIDVGTGLALFLEGRDFTLVYDGGSNDDLARGADNRMLAYLKKVRPDLRVIDQLILSHPHRDHVELLPDLFDAYQVKNVWESGRTNDICGYRAFIDKITAEPGVIYHDAIGDFGKHDATFAAKTCYGVPEPAGTISVPRGSRISTAPVPLGSAAQMTILHADPVARSNINENSVVVRLDLGPARILLMGDAEAGGRHDPGNAPSVGSIEGQLLSCCAAALKADVLVAGHHGSESSSRAAFVNAVGASTFIISAGPTRYASVTLPDAVIVNEFTSHGTLWRTDLNDATCGAEPAKIGPDADHRAGGCDNIRISIDEAGHISTAYSRLSD